MKRVFLAVLIAAGLGSFLSCSATKVNPGAERVRITNTEPKNCKYLGEVMGSQGNAITGGWTSNNNLALGARNDLKNKAHALGGNLIHLLNSRDGQTSSQYGGSNTSARLMGVAYNCPNLK